jgi:hypothetical protein
VLKNISVSLAVATCLINEFIRGLYGGFSYGASKMCNTVYPIIEIGGVRSWMSHADPYSSINQNQIYLAYALLIFIACKLIERGWVTRLLSFAPLIFSVFFWLRIESIKNLDINDPDKYIDLFPPCCFFKLSPFQYLSVKSAKRR